MSPFHKHAKVIGAFLIPICASFICLTWAEYAYQKSAIAIELLLPHALATSVPFAILGLILTLARQRTNGRKPYASFVHSYLTAWFVLFVLGL
jgi:hypothetical protein